MTGDPIEIRTFEDVEKLDQASTSAAVVEVFSAAIRVHGFDCFLIADLPPKGSVFEQHIILNGWPEGWYKHYISNRYYDVDPVAICARNSIQPFYWSEAVTGVPGRRPLASRRIMAEAADNGLHEGLVVPVYSSIGDQSCVTMGGPRQESVPRSRSALNMLSMFAMHKARALRNQNRLDVLGSKDRPRLSAREVECLRWIAAGKTDEDIAAILDISSHTVSAHVRNASRKLSTFSRTHTVVLALLDRHMTL